MPVKQVPVRSSALSHLINRTGGESRHSFSLWSDATSHWLPIRAWSMWQIKSLEREPNWQLGCLNNCGHQNCWRAERWVLFSIANIGKTSKSLLIVVLNHLISYVITMAIDLYQQSFIVLKIASEYWVCPFIFWLISLLCTERIQYTATVVSSTCHPHSTVSFSRHMPSKVG